MKPHHVGYAVRDIQKSISQFALFGFEICSEMTDDLARNVKICFIRNQDMLIELVAPLNADAPISNWLKMNDCSPYHLCYESRNIHEDIMLLKKNGAKEIQKPLPAPAIEGKEVVFLYLSSVGIIELVESGD